MNTERPLSLDHETGRILNFLQRECGDDFWDVLDETDPGWLEERFGALYLEEEVRIVQELKLTS
jgi:hypothetical protein